MNRKSVSSKTFICTCGHLAYWVNRKGWHCFCGDPRKWGHTYVGDNRRIYAMSSPAKGPLVR